MLDTQQLPPHRFVLEGIFLGYLNPKQKKKKAIVLEIDQEQCVIKLPKKVRASLQNHQLQAGERIRCIGRSRVDFKAGVISLKAYQVFRLPPSADNSRSALPKTPVSTIVASPRVSADLPISTGKKAKILVCRKSGCQKRGSRQLVATLETLLQQHQLTDRVNIQYTGCQKRCSKAPTLTIMPGNHRYDRLDLHTVHGLIKQHFISLNPVQHQSNYEGNKVPPAID